MFTLISLMHLTHTHTHSLSHVSLSKVLEGKADLYVPNPARLTELRGKIQVVIVVTVVVIVMTVVVIVVTMVVIDSVPFSMKAFTNTHPCTSRAYWVTSMHNVTPHNKHISEAYLILCSIFLQEFFSMAEEVATLSFNEEYYGLFVVNTKALKKVSTSK